MLAPFVGPERVGTVVPDSSRKNRFFRSIVLDRSRSRSVARTEPLPRSDEQRTLIVGSVPNFDFIPCSTSPGEVSSLKSRGENLVVRVDGSNTGALDGRGLRCWWGERAAATANGRTSAKRREQENLVVGAS